MSGKKQRSIKDYLINLMEEVKTERRRTLLMKPSLNDIDMYTENEARDFWNRNINEFKYGEYYLTYDDDGIVKIERVDEANIKN